MDFIKILAESIIFDSIDDLKNIEEFEYRINSEDTQDKESGQN